jgi:hypothetical protein
MLLEAAVATIIVGLIWALLIRRRTGCFPPRFGQLDLRYPWLFFLAFFIQFLLIILGLRQVAFIAKWFPFVYLGSYLILFFAAVKNWSLFGMRIALLGIALNFTVILLNGGHMPADAKSVARIGKSDLLTTPYYPRSRPIGPQTRLPFLGDVIILPKPYPFPQIFSLGDVFVTLGAMWLILSGLGLLAENFARLRRTAAKT